MNILADFVAHFFLHAGKRRRERRTNSGAVCKDEVDGYGLSLYQIAVEMKGIAFLVQHFNIGDREFFA